MEKRCVEKRAKGTKWNRVNAGKPHICTRGADGVDATAPFKNRKRAWVLGRFDSQLRLSLTGVGRFRTVLQMYWNGYIPDVRETDIAEMKMKREVAPRSRLVGDAAEHFLK